MYFTRKKNHPSFSCYLLFQQLCKSFYRHPECGGILAELIQQLDMHLDEIRICNRSFIAFEKQYARYEQAGNVFFSLEECTVGLAGPVKFSFP